jgi:hypothetical protein
MMLFQLLLLLKLLLASEKGNDIVILYSWFVLWLNDVVPTVVVIETFAGSSIASEEGNLACNLGAV